MKAVSLTHSSRNKTNILFSTIKNTEKFSSCHNQGHSYQPPEHKLCVIRRLQHRAQNVPTSTAGEEKEAHFKLMANPTLLLSKLSTHNKTQSRQKKRSTKGTFPSHKKHDFYQTPLSSFTAFTSGPTQAHGATE